MRCLGFGPIMLALSRRLQSASAEDKTARTLATSLLGVTTTMLRNFGPDEEVAGGGCEIWFVHVLIGDGIGANEAAAKLMLASQAHRWSGARYFLLSTKCGSHQSALTAKSGVEGRIAAAASKEKEHEGVTGCAVRFFKYSPRNGFNPLVSRPSHPGIGFNPSWRSQPQAARPGHPAHAHPSGDVPTRWLPILPGT